MVKLELPRGMRDLEPEDFSDIAYVRDNFIETAKIFNFKIMEPSTLELLSTLEAKGGATISNEIYAFTDKGNREVALRFDLTIGLTRYVALRRDLKMPAKLATFAGVWRYDEPQAGRYRYFHQWDVEVYGPFGHESDAEVIEFVASFFKRLGLNVAIEINDRQIMEQYIRKRLGISNESAILELFRAIDKVPKKGAQAVLQEYRDSLEPAKLRSLIELSKTRGSVDHVSSATDMKDIEGWQRLVDLMDSLSSRKVQDVHINLGIVRGLDYYSGVVFEAFDKLADSGALVGGGRYDRLTEAFGRKDIGATGVAGGVERIVMALRKHGIVKGFPRPLVYVAYATENERSRAVELVTTLRSAGTTTDYDLHGRALRRQLDDASNKGAMLTVIVTELEFAAGQVVVRQMRDGTENKYRISTLPQEIAKILRA